MNKLAFDTSNLLHDTICNAILFCLLLSPSAIWGNNNVVPIINDCPENLTVFCSDGAVFFQINEWINSSMTNLETTTSDGCTESIEVTSDFTASVFTEYFEGGCNEDGTVITFTVTDECAISATCTATLFIVDDVGPEFLGLTAISNLIPCNSVVEFEIPEILDDCSEIESSSFVDTEVNSCAGIRTTRTWTARDICGNETSVSQTLVRVDLDDPVIDGVGASTNFECGTVPVFSNPTASDNCDEDIEFDFEDFEEENATCAGRRITRVWTAIDNCGNTSTASQTLISNDVTNPVISGIITTGTYTCHEEPEFSTLSVADDCDDNPDFSYQTIDGTSSCGGASKVRIWTAIDHCGNTRVVSQTMIAIDDEDPSIVGIGPDGTFECGTTPIFSTPEAFDNCDGNVMLNFSDNLNASVCGNIITRTWTAVDDCNNYLQLSQTMTAVDNIPPPAPTAPDFLELSCSEMIPPPVTLTSQDECGGNVIIGIPEDNESSLSSCSNSRTITRTWAFTDDCDNTSYTSQVIVVNDNEAPQAIAVPDDIMVGCNDDIPDAVTVFATDNCDDDFEVSMTSEIMSEDICTGATEIVRTWSLIDQCGNQQDVHQTIFFVDDEPPFIFFPDEIEMNCSETIDDEFYINNYVLDECADLLDLNVTFETDIQNCTIDGACCEVMVRNYVITDPCGNEGYGTLRFRIKNDPPEINCPSYAEVENFLTADLIDPDVLGMATATDICSNDLSISFEDGEVNGSCFIRTWFATEACGNVTTCEQEICSTIALPLELIDFSGTINADFKSILKWYTQNEVGVDYYLLEHSTDGFIFQTIGSAPAKGNGVNGEFFYQHQHDQVVRGKNYYRLKMVDLNSDFKYSNTIVLEARNEIEEVILYPNPTHGVVMLQFPDFEGFTNTAPVDIYLYDELHRLIKVYQFENVSSELLMIELENIIPGTYLLKIIHGSNSFSKMIIYKDQF